ncbi:hypothetical protein [Streptomyces sp. NBC_01435]|uniref:hypothetical protein n=1 Tax=Streptomyces sp. NBC_01435 TaxID=2903865 RepID=UPI002E377D43|nr:hypothetical protein [Streptomyces sp. NBC_01435]
MASSVLVEDSDQAGPEPGHSSRRDVIAAVITCAAIAAATVHMVRPALKIDGVTAVHLAMTIVPWRGNLIDSIELPGGTRFQYRQLADRMKAAEERSVQTGRAADDPCAHRADRSRDEGRRGRRGIGHFYGKVRGICPDR